MVGSVNKFSAQEFCIVIQGSRAGSCERQMVGGPSQGHLNECNRYLEMATKFVAEKRQMLQKTDTNRQGELEQIHSNCIFSLSELKYKDAESTKTTIKYKSFAIHVSQFRFILFLSSKRLLNLKLGR